MNGEEFIEFYAAMIRRGPWSMPIDVRIILRPEQIDQLIARFNVAATARPMLEVNLTDADVT
jgi:hypothetical protein